MLNQQIKKKLKISSLYQIFYLGHKPQYTVIYLQRRKKNSNWNKNLSIVWPCSSVVAKGCVDVRGQCWCLGSVLWPEFMWMSVFYVCTWAHVDVHDLCCLQGLYGCPTAAGGHVDVRGPCYHWRPYECSSSVLQPEAMLMSVGCVTARNQKGKEMSFAVL